MTRPSERAAHYLNLPFRIVAKTITSFRKAYAVWGGPAVPLSEADRLQKIVWDAHNVMPDLHDLLAGGRAHLSKHRRDEELGQIEVLARAGNHAKQELTAAIAVNPELDLPSAVFAEARRPRGFWENLIRPSRISTLADAYHATTITLTCRLRDCVKDDHDLGARAVIILYRMGAIKEAEPC